MVQNIETIKYFNVQPPIQIYPGNIDRRAYFINKAFILIILKHLILQCCLKFKKCLNNLKMYVYVFIVLETIDVFLIVSILVSLYCSGINELLAEWINTVKWWVNPPWSIHQTTKEYQWAYHKLLETTKGYHWECQWLPSQTIIELEPKKQFEKCW